MLDLVQKHKVALIGLLSILIIAIIATALSPRTSDEIPEAKPPQVRHFEAAKHRPAWPADDDAARPVEISIGESGPVWRAPSGQEVLLAPAPEGATSMKWSLKSEGDISQITGTGDWRGAALTISVIFIQGDPQISVELSMREVPLAALQHSIVSSVVLPPGDFWAIDQRLRYDQKVAPAEVTDAVWLSWHDDAEHPVTLSALSADGVNATTSMEGTRVEISIWDARKRALPEDCARDYPETVTLSARWVATMGATPAVIASHLPGGKSGAFVPIFTDPGASSNPNMQSVAPDTVEEWLRRAKTIAYGHSSPEDPRYGNGGLLGAGLGGTLAVPTRFWSDPQVQAFSDALFGTTVDVVPEGPASAPGTSALVLATWSCAHFIEAIQSDSLDVVIVPGAQASRSSHLVSGFKSVDRQAMPSMIRPLALDGAKRSLHERAFTESAVENIGRERGMEWFATPLVASRNPLLPVAKQALLAPERQGHWTLDEEFTRAVTSLELMPERKNVLFTSATALERYQRASANMALWHSPSGSLWTVNDSQLAVPGYTLVIFDGRPANTLRRSDRQRPPMQTKVESDRVLMWWDVAENERYEAVFDPLPWPAMSPVRWNIVD